MHGAPGLAPPRPLAPSGDHDREGSEKRSSVVGGRVMPILLVIVVVRGGGDPDQAAPVVCVMSTTGSVPVPVERTVRAPPGMVAIRLPPDRTSPLSGCHVLRWHSMAGPKLCPCADVAEWREAQDAAVRSSRKRHDGFRRVGRGLGHRHRRSAPALRCNLRGEAPGEDCRRQSSTALLVSAKRTAGDDGGERIEDPSTKRKSKP